MVLVIFLPKNDSFLHKNDDISKVKDTLVLKVKLSEATKVCVLT